MAAAGFMLGLPGCPGRNSLLPDLKGVRGWQVGPTVVVGETAEAEAEAVGVPPRGRRKTAVGPGPGQESSSENLGLGSGGERRRRWRGRGRSRTAAEEKRGSVREERLEVEESFSTIDS